MHQGDKLFAARTNATPRLVCRDRGLNRGTATQDDFEIGQNNRIHSPNDGDPTSVTLVGATIVDVRTPQNAALVGTAA